MLPFESGLLFEWGIQDSEITCEQVVHMNGPNCIQFINAQNNSDAKQYPAHSVGIHEWK